MAASEAQPSPPSVANPVQVRPASTAHPPVAADVSRTVPVHPQPSNVQQQRGNVPPQTRYQFPFPNALEVWFGAFDDRFIRYAQQRTTGLVHFFAMTLTAFTAIETSLFVPPCLFALGYDAAGGLSTSVLLVLGVVSQMPKKFIFRARPWMVGRALPIRRDKTSSFPSRAVVCAVVFSWLAAKSLELERVLERPLPPILLWVGILLVACCAAAARVNVGAHYPSDTVLGFMLGCLIINIGARLEDIWQGMGCSVMIKYANELDEGVLSTGRQWSFRNLSLVTAIAYVMTLISIQGFWAKCSYVYGLLMASTAFRASFLCVRLADGSRVAAVARVMQCRSLQDHVQAAATFGTVLVFGMATRGVKGKSRIATFSVIYTATLLGLLHWRV